MLGKNKPLIAVLKPLRDVEGVIGAALWDSGGNLLAQDFPDLWGPDALREVGVRVAYLFHSFGGEAGQFSDTTLVFADHKLQLRPFGTTIIGVLLAGDGNVSALQMALNIAVRQLGQEAQAHAHSARDPRSPHDPHSSYDHTSSAAQAPSGGRLYRGQRLPE
jgi:predicted regulator of Ras-like GTPase activity (Roadblock/LC7/MglB family)